MTISIATGAHARLLRFRCSHTRTYAARRFSNPSRDRHVAAKLLGSFDLIISHTPSFPRKRESIFTGGGYGSPPARGRQKKKSFLSEQTIFLALVILMASDAQAQMHPGGQVVKDCWDKGGSHVAIVDCEAQERDRLKSEMLQRYNNVKKEAREMDDEMVALGSLAGAYREQGVIDSQKAFEKYLEAECQRMMNIASGGTAGADYHVGCEIDLIMQRMERLGNDSERNETGNK